MRIKPKYNPKPTAQEKAYHIWLMAAFPCVCGCGGQATVVHHPLTRHPLQRWRRDHEFVVPMTAECHMALHQCGREALWRDDLALDQRAYWYRVNAISEGKLRDESGG